MSCVFPCFGPDQQIQGYEYLVIDDCWASDRGEDGVLIPDPAAFPDGMKAVADYVHSKDRTMGSPMGFVPKNGTSKSYGFYQFVNIQLGLI
jgi:alpha-galactosidase